MSSLHSFLLERLKHKLSNTELYLLPHGCSRTGHVIIIDLHDSLLPYQKEIGNTLLSFFPKQQTVLLKRGPTQTLERVPEYEIIAGDSTTETIHKELGCYFKIDPLKVTFSAGNHFERKRLIACSRDGETIVDMFACVGNLSLPICVHKDVNVIGIEINPVAYEYLIESIQMNRVEDRYIALQGDNREVTPQDSGDRVIMGYWGIAPDQVLTAIKALRRTEGGWIHFHELCERKLPFQAIKMTQTALNTLNNNFQIELIQSRRVKWVSGILVHYVHDLHIIPQ